MTEPNVTTRRTTLGALLPDDVPSVTLERYPDGQALVALDDATLTLNRESDHPVALVLGDDALALTRTATLALAAGLLALLLELDRDANRAELAEQFATQDETRRRAVDELTTQLEPRETT